MRIRRKSNACLNCKASLDSVYNFCPICGQENNNNNISFGQLIAEFFTNYFSLDSRVAKSIFPFFLKPGYLTNSYNRGLRLAYMHPVRLYLIISLFYFFVFQITGNKIVAEQVGQAEAIKQDVASGSMDEMEKILNENLKEIPTPPQAINIQQLEDSLYLDSILSATSDAGKNLASTITQSINKANQPVDSATLVSDEKVDEDEGGDSNWNIVEKLRNDRSISDQKVYDSLALENNSDFEKYLWRQWIRVRRSDEKFLVNYVVDNLPLMMLLLLPIFALILKLLYIRSKILYIKHLIHALHLHSFAYFIYGITLLTTVYLNFSDSANGWIMFISFVLVSTYAYISFLKVYKQGWFKTLVKFNLVGFIYQFFLFNAIIAEVFISFLLY